MTKIILLVLLSGALGVVNAGPYRGRNVEVPVELIKEPVTVELIKEEIIIPVEQLKIAEEIKLQEPVAVISEKIVDNEENRIETVVVQETIVPKLKTETEPEKVENDAEPVVVEVIEAVKTIIPAAEPAKIETVVVPLESEQKVEIFEAAEPAVKTVTSEDEEVKNEIRQTDDGPPTSPGLLGVVQTFIQNTQLNPLNLLNRASTSSPPKPDNAADGSVPLADVTPQPTIVEQFQSGLQASIQNVQQTLNTALNAFQLPGQAGTAAAPAVTPADSNAPQPAAAPAAAAPAGPIQQFVSNVQSTVQSLFATRQPAAPAAAAPLSDSVPVASALPADAETLAEKSAEVEDEPVKSEEEEEPTKEE